MAIRSVNGVNVYVLEPKEVTGKTTSGKNFATLYSDLRWQVWEEVQKSELAKLDLERMSVKAKADIYEQSQRDIRRAVTELQTLKAQVLTGGSTANQAARTAAKQAELDLRAATKSAELAAKAAPKIRTVTGRVSPFDESVTLPPLVVREEREGPVPGVRAPKIGEVLPSEEDIAAGQRRTVGLEFLDAEIKKLEEQLIREQEAYASGATAGDFDVLGRTRRAFERDIGVMGQGGGAFGLAPRSGRLLPRVDQPLAQERVDKLASAIELDKAELAAAEEARDILEGEKEALFRARKKPEDNQEAIEEINMQLQPIYDRIGRKPILEQAMEAPEFREVAGGDFLRRSRKAEMEALGIPEEELTPIVPEVVPELAPEEAKPVREILPKEPRLRIPRPAREQPEAAPVPEAQVIPVGDRGLDPLTAEVLGIKPARISDQPMVLNKESLLSDPTVLDDPMFTYDPALAKEAEDFFRSKRGRQQRDPVKFFRTEKEMVKEYLKGQMPQPETIDDFELRGEVVPSVEEARAPSTRQRKEKYKIDVISEGIKLASQPKRLSRLAKTDSTVRPAHLQIVDKLYETNKGKAAAFKLTYDEISRVFAQDPVKRKEAHSYLVAKDTLEQNVTEPVA